MSNRQGHYTGGSSSPNTRGTHSPPMESTQVHQSIEVPVVIKPTPVEEDQAASQQLANEQLGTVGLSTSAAVATVEGPRNIIDIASQDTSEPSVVDYVGPPLDDMCSNWLDNNICTVIIGDGDIKEKIGVHENLLLYKSPYFRRILKASNKAELGEIFLNDVDVRLFKLLVRWMYGTALGRVFRYGLPDAEVSVHDYIGLYVLASQLEIPAAKNCIMDTIYNYYAEDVPELRCPAVADLRMVMDNLPEDSPLERLLTAHLLFTCFSTKRDGAPVPDDWILIRESGRIGYGLITMLTEWKWLLGRNVPPMKIRDRHHFHEKLDAPPVGSRSQIRVVIKAEPGTDGSDQPQTTPAPRPAREPVAEQDFSAAAARAPKRPAATQHPDADGGAQGPSSSAPASSLRPAKRPAYRKGAAVVRAAAAAVAAAKNPAGGAAKVPGPNGSPEDPISL